ncbi:MAG: hypothetical protein Q4Q07_05235 [Tissierellia bacterium]|nr:hypothetical protein [Tissierellia bacterium]
MYLFIAFIIIIFSVTNMIADVLLVSGKRPGMGKESGEAIAERTPIKHLFISAVLGLISISMWITPIYFLRHLPTSTGTWAMLFFAFYICSCAAFHVTVAYSVLCYKCNPELITNLKKVMMIFGFICVFWSSLYTISIIRLSTNHSLNLHFFHYITLPIFSMIIVQFLLPKVFKKVLHFSSIAGTLGMMISLLSTIHFMAMNHI